MAGIADPRVSCYHARIMLRQICWKERNEEGIRREIRVTVQRGQVKWQFKAEDQDRWDYDGPPSTEEWDSLLERMENRYQRRNVSFDDLSLVRREHARATGKGTTSTP